MVRRTLAHHGPERLVIDHPALLLVHAGRLLRAGVLAERVDARVLRRAVAVAPTLGLYWRRRHRVIHQGRFRAVSEGIAEVTRRTEAGSSVVFGPAICPHRARGGCADLNANSV